MKFSYFHYYQKKGNLHRENVDAFEEKATASLLYASVVHAINSSHLDPLKNYSTHIECSTDITDISFYENHIRGFCCDFRPFSNTKANISLHKSRRVIDPIADHGNNLTLPLKLLNLLNLGSRKCFCDNTV